MIVRKEDEVASVHQERPSTEQGTGFLPQA